MSDTGSGRSIAKPCPFASDADATGCDCDCNLPRPRGFWATVRWLLGARWCVSGQGGCGNGMLPCGRFDRWRRENSEVDVARKFFDAVYGLVEAGCDDVIYDVVDPEQEDDDICGRFNLDTIREVISLGFRRKYGADWTHERGNGSEEGSK